MLKKLIDTNIFIDRFSNLHTYQDIFLSDGIIYLSSVVLMELRAGAHTKKSLRAVNELSDFFRRVDRIVAPSINDYERAGRILAKLQSEKGYDIKKCAAITDDCLIAASARSMGAVLYTQNKKDFQAIQDIFDFMVSFV
ncbi:MAG: PIN domain-containing protein [Proteobacteria bacterium]|nr:PIN domain-containing protein [Pseudomonadota bacterium]